jgi:hypothetical protein
MAKRTPTRRPAKRRSSSRPASTAKSAKPKRRTAPRVELVKPRERRDALELVSIGMTPPELAPGTDAFRVNAKLSNRWTRPKPETLAKLPWLSQDDAYQAGYYLLTHGLREHADHPEIEVCNVPGAFVPSAMRLLNHLADYVLNDGRLSTAETTMVDSEPLAVVGFMRIAPQARGTVHDEEVLRVVFVR